MSIKLVTTYNNKLYDDYAFRFFQTYNWKFELKHYNEDRNMYNLIPDCKTFVERNKHRMEQSSYKEKNTSYVKDGVRFCYKVYAYTHEILQASNGVDGIIGIDVDSVFYKSIDDEWIFENIHRDDCMMTYLGRGEQYSECGFLYFNMKHPQIKNYAREMKRMYDEDLIYNLPEQHDSYVWDYVRKQFESKGVKNYNIGDTKGGHVQARSILGSIYDHTKGPRKLKGRSPEARV